MEHRLINPIPIEDIRIINSFYNMEFEGLELIGEGAEGEVYRYKDYAIKWAEDSNDGYNLEKLQGNPIFPKLYFYTDEYIVMEYINIKEKETYDYFERNVDFEQNALDIFKYCYNKGLIPYDIHSENVIVTENDELKIIDVGAFISVMEHLDIHYYLNKYRLEYEELDRIINHVKRPPIAI